VFVDRVEFKATPELTLFPKDEGMLELPTCPVCLERMDAVVSGLFGLVCNHTFHCKCLAKWGDSSCPVCRYNSDEPDEASNECATCGAHEDLWMCLICGAVAESPLPRARARALTRFGRARWLRPVRRRPRGLTLYDELASLRVRAADAARLGLRRRRVRWRLALGGG
jgi:hypothetical protein